VVCDDGSRVRTGKISLGTGHAQLGLAAGAAKEHYDNTGSAVADIVVGEDNYGIWFSGAVRPDVDDTSIRAFRASAVSGDWRTIGGGLEMVALLAVNTPGFPVPRANLVASAAGDTDEPTALVSAGALAPAVVEEEFKAKACCDECAKKNDKKEEEQEMSTDETEEFDEGCGCGKPKPQPKVEFSNADLLALDLAVLDATVESLAAASRPKNWDGRCYNLGFAARYPKKCGTKSKK
jgi:hypothetical protein